MSAEIKKVFIDGGAHIGESVDLFFELYPDAKEYEIHSFEPNPDNWEAIEKKLTKLHKVGLWDNNSKMSYFKGNGEDKSAGGTFLLMKHSGKVDYDNPIASKVIRLSQWIRDNFEMGDYIVLKLDIEGAEYAVLDDLIDTGVISWIDELLGELHGTGPNGRILSLPISVRPNMEARLHNLGIELKEWGGNKK